MSDKPLMPKATAVWLIENTSLTFEQIADFCGIHPLEVKGIADEDVAKGIKGIDPIATGQLTHDQIERAEKDPEIKLAMAPGFGRDRYFYSFVVALLLFSLGSVFALYEGIHKLESHEPLTSPLVAVVILVVAIGLESFSFRTAIHESRPLKGYGTLVAVHPPGEGAGAAGRAAGGPRRARRPGPRAPRRRAHA